MPTLARLPEYEVLPLPITEESSSKSLLTETTSLIACCEVVQTTHFTVAITIQQLTRVYIIANKTHSS